MTLVLLLVFATYYLAQSDGYPNPYEMMSAEDRAQTCPGIAPDYPLLEYDVECKSADKRLYANDGRSLMKDVFECKRKCMDTNGCKFYVFGKGSKYGKCYWEKTEPDKNNKICPEKWKNNEYDFYQVLGKCSIAQWKIDRKLPVRVLG